jgi:hypothetical protein
MTYLASARCQAEDLFATKISEVYGGLADSNNANIGSLDVYTSILWSLLLCSIPALKVIATIMYGLVNRFSFTDRLPIDCPLFGVYRLLSLLK